MGIVLGEEIVPPFKRICRILLNLLIQQTKIFYIKNGKFFVQILDNKQREAYTLINKLYK